MKGEKLLYQDNKLGYNLVLAFITLNLFITIMVLRSMTINAIIGAYVMYNIVLSLVGFLVAIKVKKYTISFGIVSIVIGVVQFFLAFNMPMIPNPTSNLIITLLVIVSSLILAAGGVITIHKSKLRSNFLRQRKN